MMEFLNGFATRSGVLEVFRFNPVTGEYLGPCTTYISEGCGLTPGQALDAPPISAAIGQAIQRCADTWVVVEDHRGLVYRTLTGEAVQHDQLGPLAEGLTQTPRPSPAYRWQAGTWVLDPQLQAEMRQAFGDALLRLVDRAADVAHQALVGHPLRAIEYDKVAAEAQAFKDAGYPEQAVPRTVAAGLTSGLSAREAADSILASHARYQEQMDTIREVRLASKAQIRELLMAEQDEAASQAAREAVAALQAVSA